MIQKKGKWRTWENKAKVVGLTGKFLMKLKSEEIENGQDNTTQVKSDQQSCKMRCKDCKECGLKSVDLKYL